MENAQLVLVDIRVLPEVFEKVLQAKAYLSRDEARNSTEACRMAGLSRSAFYKYKDSVFYYEDKEKRQVSTFSLWLSDDPGVLSRVLAKLSQYGVNILTVNQNIPVDQVALVTISFRLENGKNAESEMILEAIGQMPGVVRAKQI